MTIEKGPQAQDELKAVVDELRSSPEPVDDATLGLEPQDIEHIMEGLSDGALRETIESGDCERVERYFWNAAHQGTFTPELMRAHNRWWSKYHIAFGS